MAVECTVQDKSFSKITIYTNKTYLVKNYLMLMKVI